MNSNQAFFKQSLLSDEAKQLRRIRRIARKGNPSVVKAKGAWKVSKETKVLQLVEKIITPLENIIYLYIPTDYYNYIPGTKKDCWYYMERRIERVYCNLNSMVFLNDDEYNRVLKIIDTVHAFVKGFSGVDSIKDPHWFELNPNLYFFHSCYSLEFEPDMKDWTEDDFEVAQYLPFSYMPKSLEEVEKRERYIEYLHCYSKERNFKWDKYDTSQYSHEDPESIMLMHEIAYTLRLVFIDAFPELCNDES